VRSRSKTVHEDDRLAFPYIEKGDFYVVALKPLHIRNAHTFLPGTAPVGSS
jgi:hypothetical protein